MAVLEWHLVGFVVKPSRPYEVRLSGGPQPASLTTPALPLVQLACQYLLKTPAAAGAG
jgi:hypothetical protein